MNSADVRAALRESYKQPEWALFFEVADGTGAAKRRTADGLMMNMYPSRGLTVHGLEFKVSRSDWLRELKDPDKAESVARFCDLWSVVAPKDMIRAEELPRTWGLIEVDGGRTRVRHQPAERKPDPLTRHFVAALVRSVAKVDERAVESMVNARVAKALEDREARINAEVDRRTREAKEIVEKHAAFAASLRKWNGLGNLKEEEVIRGLELLDELGINSRWSGLRNLLTSVDALSNVAAKIREELKLGERG